MLDSGKSFEDFIGFGNEEGDVLFLGMEEGLLGTFTAAHPAARSEFPRTADLRADYSPDASRFYFWRLPKSQRTWRAMSHLMLRRQGIDDPTDDQLYRYQSEQLGRVDGETLLSELLPKANRSMDEAYIREVLPHRVRLLRDVIGNSGFEVVVAHGRDSDWSTYKDIFGIRHWREQGDFAYANVNGQRIVLAPHLGSALFDTTAQLNRLSEVALVD
ncbi:MAG TPA: hypothetical protein VME66_10520 [Candidatus Acidoferrales bacterium]|nr:hypothetical protein [Candidatus Acidoferrales bacterium]